MDFAFETLKKLNALGVNIKRKYNTHIKNSAIEVHSKAAYHIGQTLHYREKQCRCVVIGKF